MITANTFFKYNLWRKIISPGLLFDVGLGDHAFHHLFLQDNNQKAFVNIL
jgi:hypothetical protein